MKISLTTLLAFLFLFSHSSLSFAKEGSTSEYLHQTDAGLFELTPNLTLGGGTAKFKGTSTSADVSLFGLGVIGEYGINSTISAGAKLLFTNASVKVSSVSHTSSGLTNPDIFLNGKVAAGSGLFRFGADLALSLAKEKFESNGDTNADSGGSTFTPWVGYEFVAGGATLGAQLKYDLFMGDRSIDNNGSSQTQTGGASTMVAMFVEGTPSPDILFGGALVYSSWASSKTGSTDNHDVSSTIGIQPYLTVKAGSVDLLAKLIYSTQTYSDSASLSDTTSIYAVNFGARFTF